ncbi:MAG: hypothetical protein ACRD5K_11720 [Candidatus Acidiferrales bacterium]
MKIHEAIFDCDIYLGVVKRLSGPVVHIESRAARADIGVKIWDAGRG